jgi:hypothetical protein
MADRAKEPSGTTSRDSADPAIGPGPVKSSGPLD